MAAKNFNYMLSFGNQFLSKHNSLPCPPRINSQATSYIKLQAMQIFQSLCPPTLRIVDVQPNSSGRDNYSCSWIVKYDDDDLVQPLTNEQICGELQARRPSFTEIIRKNKEFSCWNIEYGVVDCNCGMEFASSEEWEENNYDTEILRDINMLKVHDD
ncbi:hypothetical protein Trydic_g23004 [Trypoxylus dichotomus]